MCPSPRRPIPSGKLPSEPQVDRDLLKEGRALGHLQIMRSIGTGGMSEVYLAYHPKSRRQVALKILADHLVDNHTFVNRFLHEGRLGKKLTHPNIVQGFDYGRDKATGKYFILMQFVDGPNAQERLEQAGRLPVAEAARIVIDIARALEYLHHLHFVHRDIKPGNILIAPDGSAKLADLGVAKFLDNASGLTTLDQSVGTPYYMPWEQCVNACLVDGRSDIFALGATFYHLITGHVPFPGDDEGVIARSKAKGKYLPARHHLRRLPKIVDVVLERMLALNPRKRFSTAREVVEVLTASGLTDGCPSPVIEMPVPASQPIPPTRADLKAQAEIETPLEAGDEPVWFVKFKRAEDGTNRKVRGRTGDIIRFYEDGLLPDESLAAREPSKVFRRIKAYPEFRNAVRKPMELPLDPKKAKPLRKIRGAAARSGFSWTESFRGFFLTSLLAGFAACGNW